MNRRKSRRIWVVEARAPKSLSQNYWAAWSFHATKDEAVADASEQRKSQNHCMWRIAAYVPDAAGADHAD
jgi:hypothetical protein